ncbi:MAG: ABC transporter permease [Chloroflexota bacterium]
MMLRRDLLGQSWAHAWSTMIATCIAYLRRVSAYTIQLVRWPLGPVVQFITFRVTYSIAGRGQVDGASASGFLIVGMIGLVTFSSSIWVSGYAIEWEREEGTSGALFLSPASRAAVIMGYGLGSFVWFMPTFLVIGVLGAVSGATFHVADPLAVIAAMTSIIFASLATGFAMAGLFILSRRGNLFANTAQQPIYLLAGFLVPRAYLPGWLHAISNAIPAAHAVDALRATLLNGADLGSASSALLWTLGTSACFFAIGIMALRRVEYVAKHYGQLDLY